MPPARAVLYAATACAFVASVRAVVVAPPSLAVSVLAFVVYSGLVLGGVFILEWRVFVDAVVRGPKGARGIALTFDDGPDPTTTRQVLRALEDAGVKATFFVIGKKAEAHADVVREIRDQGHTVGLHSYGHDRLFALKSEACVRDDLEKGIAALTRVTGERPTLFRPPIGHTNPIIARVADELDLRVVGWSVGARDGLSWSKPERVLTRVRRGLRDGAIVLLHDASERGDFEPAAAKILGDVVATAKARNLPVVALDDWIAATDLADGGGGEGLRD